MEALVESGLWMLLQISFNLSPRANKHREMGVFWLVGASVEW